jgi:type IV pilus biogenesis protein CpaD/CtpE
MTITQTVAIPDDYRIFLELPRYVPIGAKAQISITIPTTLESQNSAEPVKSFRGVLKGKGISLKRLREMQREDKAMEDAADNRQNREIR